MSDQENIHTIEDFGLTLRARLDDAADATKDALRAASRLPGHRHFELLLTSCALDSSAWILHVNPKTAHYYIALHRLLDRPQVLSFASADARTKFRAELEINDLCAPEIDLAFSNNRDDHPGPPAVVLVEQKLDDAVDLLGEDAWPTDALWVTSAIPPSAQANRALAERGLMSLPSSEGDVVHVWVRRSEQLLLSALMHLEDERRDMVRSDRALRDRAVALERSLTRIDREKSKLARELDRDRQRVERLYASTSYRLGRTLTRSLQQPMQSARDLIARRRPDSENSPRRGRSFSHSTAREPLVSIIMTTFESAQYVQRSIDSIRAQTYSNWELVIVDDASKDDTFERIVQLTEEDARIRVMSTLRNQGTYSAKNLAINSINGDLVTFQDSDDWSRPERLSTQVEALMQRPDAVASAVNYIRVDQADRPVPGEPENGKVALIGLMFRRSPVFDVCGAFDSVRVGADAELFDRVKTVFGEDSVVRIEKPLYRALTRNDSLTTAAGTGQQSPIRTAYQSDYQDWHDLIRRGRAAPHIDFPQRRRPFPRSREIDVGVPWRRRVVAGVATIPSREPQLRRAISSLLPQVDAIHVVLNGHETVPSFLNHESIHVYRSQEIGDFRDNSKFYAIDSVGDCIFLSCDDDLVYPANYVRRLMLKLDQYAFRVVVGVHGVRLAQPLVRFLDDREVYHFREALARDEVVDLLGTGTAAFDTRHLRPSWSDFGAAGMADLWLAKVAKANRVPMICIERATHWLADSDSVDGSNLFDEFKSNDDVQTRVALESAPWGPEGWRASVARTASLLPHRSEIEMESRGYAMDFRLMAGNRDKHHP